MSEARLAPAIEVSALIGLAAAQGGFGTVLHKGDPDRGSVSLVLLERGKPVALLERMLLVGGNYGWQVRDADDSTALDQHVARARSNDPDLWFVELDVPSVERFTAELTLQG